MLPRSLKVGIAVVGVLVAGQLAADLTSGPSTAHAVLDIVGAVGAMAAFALMRRSMVVAVVVMSVLAAVSPVATPAACAGFAWLAATLALRTAVLTGAVGVVAHLIRGAWRPDDDGLSFAWWAVLIVLAYVMILGWGRFAQARGRLLRSVDADARADERARIAREMHDVLAHRLSLVATAAGALEYRPDASPERIAAAAGVVRDGVHQALDELRDVIGVLRAEDAIAGAVPPQPTAAEIPELIEESRRAGADVQFATDADLDALPDSLGRAVYRVVQEALTNARRHAPGATMDLRISGTPGEGLVIEAANPVPERVPSSHGSGTGLIGVAERVEILGGTFEVGRSGGRFRLTVSLPWSR